MYLQWLPHLVYTDNLKTANLGNIAAFKIYSDIVYIMKVVKFVNLLIDSMSLFFLHAYSKDWGQIFFNDLQTLIL